MEDKKNKFIEDIFVFIIIIALLLGIFIGVIIESPNPNEPSAMDVYRGKTTLEITYRDSVAIDSVVVFKNK